MTSRIIPLLRTVSLTLDGSGNGIAQAGPFFNEMWSPSACNISMTGAIPSSGTPATCTLSIGFQAAGATFVDSTYQVNGAASSAIDGQIVQYGQYIFATWANGNAGATATLTISGTKTIPG